MESLSEIRSRIRAAAESAGRSDVPQLIAVSKFQSTEKILALYQQGQRIFGENYVQELLNKKASLEPTGLKDLEFHFIGKLQTNKVKQLLPAVSTIHSIDSIRLLLEVEKRALELRFRPRVYFQINIDNEESKSGFSAADLPSLVEWIGRLKNVMPMGLMAIPDPSQPVEQAFRKMQELSKEYGATLGSGLSMGMSGDFEAAIQFGATVIRMGTALFGERQV